MPPSEYTLRLLKAIMGGFAPPTPHAIHTSTKASDKTSILITSAVRPEGTPSLQDATPKFIPTSDHDAYPLVDELKGSYDHRAGKR